MDRMPGSQCPGETASRRALWFSTIRWLKSRHPAMQKSLNEKKGAMSFFEAASCPILMETLQYWYDRGIACTRFDFVDFGAATPETERRRRPREIRARNADPFVQR